LLAAFAAKSLSKSGRPVRYLSIGATHNLELSRGGLAKVVPLLAALRAAQGKTAVMAGIPWHDL
jgi:hypothetical protein